MESKILFISGPRNCGKSKAIEDELNVYGNRIYFGTLWSDPKYQCTIRKHKDRRGEGWKVIESRGNVSEDILELENELCKREYPKACLVDGLTTWVINCARLTNDLYCSAREIGDGLIDIITKYPKVVWRLIDVSSDEFRDDSEMILKHVCAMIRLKLSLIENMEYLYWGNNDA